MISDHGSPSPLMDKPEQLLDAVLECASLVGDLNLGEDFFLVLHCASHEYYDAVSTTYIQAMILRFLFWPFLFLGSSMEFFNPWNGGDQKCSTKSSAYAISKANWLCVF